MKLYTIQTWQDGKQGYPFYVIVDDDRVLVHVLDIIKAAKGRELDYFEIDSQDGWEFYNELIEHIWPGIQTSAPKVNEGE